VQVALVVAADEFPILGEGHVTLEDAGAHTRACLMALLGMLGELQRPAPAVTNGEGGLGERAIGTVLELPLEPAFAQLVNEIERAGTKLHPLPPCFMGMLSPLGSVIGRCPHETGRRGQERYEGQGDNVLMHRHLLTSLAMKIGLDGNAYGPLQRRPYCRTKLYGCCVPVRSQG